VLSVFGGNRFIDFRQLTPLGQGGGAVFIGDFTAV
jgi:hypothetical protein